MIREGTLEESEDYGGKDIVKQESRAAARKPRDAASVLFC